MTAVVIANRHGDVLKRPWISHGRVWPWIQSNESVWHLSFPLKAVRAAFALWCAVSYSRRDPRPLVHRQSIHLYRSIQTLDRWWIFMDLVINTCGSCHSLKLLDGMWESMVSFIIILLLLLLLLSLLLQRKAISSWLCWITIPSIVDSAAATSHSKMDMTSWLYVLNTFCLPLNKTISHKHKSLLQVTDLRM